MIFPPCLQQLQLSLGLPYRLSIRQCEVVALLGLSADWPPPLYGKPVSPRELKKIATPCLCGEQGLSGSPRLWLQKPRCRLEFSTHLPGHSQTHSQIPEVGTVSGSTLISSEVMALGGKGLRLHSLSSPGTQLSGSQEAVACPEPLHFIDSSQCLPQAQAQTGVVTHHDILQEEPDSTYRPECASPVCQQQFNEVPQLRIGLSPWPEGSPCLSGVFLAGMTKG